MVNALDNHDRIAVIGMAGRFPGARDLGEFWHNLVSGTDCISRAEDFAGVSANEQGLVEASGRLDGAEEFDAAFFGFSPREAEVLDPQQRLFLQTSWHALEDAGWPAGDDCRVGVFASTSLSTYYLHNVLRSRSTLETVGQYQAMLSNDKDFLATRVAYKLGLTGPAVTVQTACSSSLSAIHLACQSLLAGECDVALAGGVSISSPLSGGYLYEPGGILSPDGTCRPFDEAANGTVPGNGVGVVVLRRWDDASYDRVRAVVRGSAMNNDGSLKVGYTAPSADGQSDVVAEALAMADINPDLITYVETHGTATPIGDPIEVTGLAKALRERSSDIPCVLGSVKSNIGHLDAASGVAAFIKTVLMLEHQILVPTCHFTYAHPDLRLAERGFEVLQQARPWDVPTARCAGVSSFGIGGTNVHVVLMESAPPPESEPVEVPLALAVSGRTTQAAAEQAHLLADVVDDPSCDLAAIVATLGRRRPLLGFTAAVAGEDRAGLARRLRAVSPEDVWREPIDRPRVCFLFPGQGSQFPAMGRDLYQDEPVYRAAFDECAALFARFTGTDLISQLYGDSPASAELLSRTEQAQPALFAVEYATYQLWHSWGVVPDVMIGHSIGELAAACVAGVWSLEFATQIVATRGRVMSEQEPGGMVSLQASLECALALLPEGCSVAAVNAPESVVIAGPLSAMQDMEQRAAAAGTSSRRLRTSHAFHSESMLPAAEAVTGVAAAAIAHAPSIPLISNLTAEPMTVAQATSGEYWGDQVRSTVRFGESVAAVLDQANTVFVEVGPGETLSRLVQQATAGDRVVAALPSLPDPRGKLPVPAAHRARLAVQNLLGDVPVDGMLPVPVGLPGYPFARDRYWIDPDVDGSEPTAHCEATSGLLWEERWSQIGSWQHDADLAAVPILAFARGPRGESVLSVLEERHAGPVLAAPSALDIFDPEAWLTQIERLGVDHVHVVHALALDGTVPARELYASLLTLCQAVARRPEGTTTTVSLLTEGVWNVDGCDPVHPDHAVGLGLMLVSPQEIQGLQTRVLDVCDLKPRETRRIEQILVWLDDAQSPRNAALRGSRFWQRDFYPVSSGQATSALRVREDGTYVITGGLGGVGLQIAGWLSEQVPGCSVALVSRSADRPDPVQEHAISRMRSRGTTVVTVAADVTDKEKLGAALDTVREACGPVRGVIHAAGVGSTAMISRADPGVGLDRCDAKVTGTRLVGRFVEQDPLDFFLLCSSVTAEFGGPGQADYAAANALLDAYALEQQAAGRPVVSVGWDTWQGIGMADRGATGGDQSVVKGVETDGVVYTATASFNSEDTWIVRDHRLMGHGLVPGTAFLEMVRSVVAPAGEATVGFRDVIFMAPVIVPAGHEKTISIQIDQSVAPWRFSVSSRDPRGVRRDHAVGLVSLVPDARQERVDLNEVLPQGAGVEVLTDQAEIGRRLGADRYRAGAGPVEFWFGPRWNLLEKVTTDGQHMLAEMRLDPAFEHDLDIYPLHPAMFDMAGGIFRMHTPAEYYLPFGYEEVTVYGPLTPHLFCAIEIEEVQQDQQALSCSIRLLSPGGELLVHAHRFTIKKVQDLGGLHAMVSLAVSESETTPEASRGIVEELMQTMTPTQALDGLRQLLSLPELPAHVVISPKDVERVRRQAVALTPADLAAQQPPTSALHPRPDLATVYAAPETDMEWALVEAWGAVLGIDGIGVDDDFFELGGHSLAAVHVNGRLKDAYGVEMDLRTFFDVPTIRNAAAVIAQRDDEEIVVDHAETAQIDHLSDDEVDAMLTSLL